MKGIICFLLFVWILPLYEAEEHVNELYTLIEKGQSSLLDPALTNQSRLLVKESTLPINELLEKSSKAAESKFSLHPLPPAGWPKHSDLAPIPRHHHHHHHHHHTLNNKSKKGPKSDRLLEHNSEKVRGEVAGLLPKTPQTGDTAAAAVATNRTVQRSGPPDVTLALGHTESDGHPNARPRGPPLAAAPPQQPAQAPAPRREQANRRLDPEENRPGGKSSLYQSGVNMAARNNSRQPVVLNRRSSSLLYHFDVLRRAESDFSHDAFCLSECRKEKEEREYYCYSEFAVNGVVHDIEVLRKGIWLITLMVSSDGFYKMSRLYVTPDSFFFKVRLLVLDTFKCSKPCPDIKLGTRYIVMGQIYHRRRHLPNDLLSLLAGKLKPGDGLLRSNNYIKRFNKRRHQKALEATRSRCR